MSSFGLRSEALHLTFLSVERRMALGPDTVEPGIDLSASRAFPELIGEDP